MSGSAMSGLAMDALQLMVEKHFRHLPVVDGEGSLVGLLDIVKCLNDTISKLGHVQETEAGASADAVKKVIGEQGANGAQAVALQALLGNLMSQVFGMQTTPTLRSLLVGKVSTAGSSDTSIRDAGRIMAESRKAALVVENGELVGIFGFKDNITQCNESS